MLDLLLLTALLLCLVAYAAQQAVAHFAHNAIRTALLALVLAGAEVYAGAVDQAVGVAGDVGVEALEPAGKKCDAPQPGFIGLGHGAGQQLFNFIADGEGFFQ